MSGLASVQTSVDLHPALGLPGQEYSSVDKQVITKIATETIKFGKYVIYSGEECEIGDSATEVGSAKGGVALRDPLKPEGYYEAGDEVAIMISGFVWVPVEETIASTDTVFVRFDGATGSEEAGFFRNDTDGATANAANPPGVVWEKGGSTVALLRLGVAGADGGATGPTS